MTEDLLPGRLVEKSSALVTLKSKYLERALQAISENPGIVGSLGDYTDVSRVVENAGYANICTPYDAENRSGIDELFLPFATAVYGYPGRMFELDGEKAKPIARKRKSTGNIGIVVDVPMRLRTDDSETGIAETRAVLDAITDEMGRYVREGEIYLLPGSSIFCTGYYRPNENADPARGERGKLERVSYREFIVYLETTNNLFIERGIEDSIVRRVREKSPFKLPVIILPDDTEQWLLAHHGMPMYLSVAITEDGIETNYTGDDNMDIVGDLITDHVVDEEEK
ncbi:MAG: hypothetical protein ABIJ92_04760 [Candidatus Aenigmatarchaeota archaeon]